VTERFKHPPHLPIAAFVNCKVDDAAIAGRRDDPHFGRLRAYVLQCDPVDDSAHVVAV
jgi:hypothetical protein